MLKQKNRNKYSAIAIYHFIIKYYRIGALVVQVAIVFYPCTSGLGFLEI